MRCVVGLWFVVMMCSVLTAQSISPASDSVNTDSDIQKLLKVVAGQQRSIDHQQEAIANQQKQIMDQRHEIEELKQQLRSDRLTTSVGNDGGSPLQTEATFNTAAVDHSTTSTASDSPLQEKGKESPL